MKHGKAVKMFKDKMYEAYASNMAGVRFYIEENRTKPGDFCVSQYVLGQKSSEYWPRYRGGIGYSADLKPYGEEFLA